MKSIVLLLVVAAVACGEKRNPDRCCTTEADCAAIGLPSGSTCPAGELCRGNECVEQTCSMSAQCDLAAPYCEDQRCAEMCSTDDSCPGAEQLNKPFCVSGGCVQCRDSSDCDDRVCVNGACVGCATDGECASGVCNLATGACASPGEIAYASATGSPTSSCTKAAPCTLLRALSIDPPRTTIKLAAGTYQNAATIVVEGKRSFSGEGPDLTKVTNANTGPVFVTGANSEATFDRLEIFGAKNGSELGVGIRCSGNMKLRLNDVRLRFHASDGLFAACDVSATKVAFTDNGGRGAYVRGEAYGVGPKFAIDRVMVSANTGVGLELEGGGTLRNTFIVRNGGAGLHVTGLDGSRPQVEFVTIADNNGTAVNCLPNFDMPTATLANILVVRNGFINPTIVGGQRTCAISSCMATIAGEPGCTLTPFNNFQFISSDVAPFNYHIQAPSAAINAAAGGVGLVDFDGETRPKGTAADLGADEVE